MLVYKKPTPGLSLPPRTCWRHWKHANVGVLGPRVTIVYQRNDAAASELIQPPDGDRRPRRVLRCRRTEALESHVTGRSSSSPSHRCTSQIRGLSNSLANFLGFKASAWSSSM